MTKRTENDVVDFLNNHSASFIVDLLVAMFHGAALRLNEISQKEEIDWKEVIKAHAITLEGIIHMAHDDKNEDALERRNQMMIGVASLALGSVLDLCDDPKAYPLNRPIEQLH